MSQTAADGPAHEEARNQRVPAGSLVYAVGDVHGRLDLLERLHDMIEADAARMARTPVVLDGFACTVAAAVLHAADPHALDHCVVAHRSAEAGHQRILDHLDKQPLFDLGLRLGEASGAALAILLLKAACACHSGMATFAEAGVSGPA